MHVCLHGRENTRPWAAPRPAAGPGNAIRSRHLKIVFCIFKLSTTPCTHFTFRKGCYYKPSSSDPKTNTKGPRPRSQLHSLARERSTGRGEGSRAALPPWRAPSLSPAPSTCQPLLPEPSSSRPLLPPNCAQHHDVSPVCYFCPKSFRMWELHSPSTRQDGLLGCCGPGHRWAEAVPGAKW